MAGIYLITNTATGHEYVGMATSPIHRWQHHRFMLRRGRHGQPKIQREWDAHGAKAFVWKRLIECRVEDLLMYERMVIDHLKPYFNGYVAEARSEAAKARYAVRDGLTLRELAERHRVYYKTVYKRMQRGWTLDNALNTPAIAKHHPRPT